MAYVAASVGDAALISMLVRRLGRLVRLKRTLEGASPKAQHRIDLVHPAMRSTLVDLARLDQADLAVAILARPASRPRGASGRGHPRTAIDKCWTTGTAVSRASLAYATADAATLIVRVSHGRPGSRAIRSSRDQVRP